MNSKALIVVGLAAVLAATTGVALSSNSDRLPRSDDGKTVATVAQKDHNDGDKNDVAGNKIYDNAVVDESAASENPTVTADEQTSTESSENTSVMDAQTNPSDSSFVVLPKATYRIRRVVERDTGEEQRPQLIFGKYYSECFLTLYNDCSAELCINPSTGFTEKGSYSVYNNTMYIDFGNDRIAEYPVIFSDENKIIGIIVDSAGYDIYFE